MIGCDPEAALVRVWAFLVHLEQGGILTRPVQALKSSSDTVGTNATMVQISWSGTSTAPKLGIPVMLMPFLITQNNSCVEQLLRRGLVGQFLRQHRQHRQHRLHDECLFSEASKDGLIAP